ncbi:low temperature requirement protein A [Micromonospora inositola]|uniref:Low temperature requirement protein LtrA n=1 Tax=Micromonospora inositola TaxID=47865 RepID=A0A1C5J4B0_9ACTN|nr:low temperature requirement protein A [Micromonospora inositola]SCG65408.1 Low temperature requirement protein LtrA [Micromonospora inositola]
MTSGRANGPPLTVEGSAERATFLELFFDLVYVFALTRVSARAFEDLAMEPGHVRGWSAVTGGGKTLLLLFALWTVWQGTAWTTSRYDPHHTWLQTIVITALVCSMVMGIATLRAFSETGLAFATAYVVAQLSRPAILLVALGRGHPYRPLKLRMLITFSVTAVFWLTGAFKPTDLRVVLWTTALGLEYLAQRCGWPVPGLGRSTVSRWDIAGEHLSERYQQFFLIALGEAILVTGLAYTGDGFTMARTAGFAIALLSSILLWRIYVQRAGQILGEAVMKAAHPATIGRSAADTHLVMVIGLVATAIGYELVLAHPLGHNEVPWIAMTLGGPAFFLAGRARFEYEVFGRVSPSRWVAILVLVALAPFLLRVASLISAAAAAVVLLGVALADARRAWGRPPEAAAPPF